MKKLKFYGDEWLLFHDIANKMHPSEIPMYFMQGIKFISMEEFAYIGGGKQMLMKQIAFNTGINKCIRSDHKKYTKVLTEENRPIKIQLLGRDNEEISAIKVEETKHDYIK